jgi:hypothetical protein
MPNVQTCNIGNAALMRVGPFAQAGVYNVLRCHLKTFSPCHAPLLLKWLSGISGLSD